MGVVSQIQAFNAGREPERLLMKYRAMRASPFAFQRSTCHLFYDRLPRGGLFKSAPLVWACGDLHIENFGSYRGDNGLVYFDINDFDEAALAPATWELARLLASVWIGADTLRLPRRTRLAACKALVDAYADALATGKAFWVERETAQGPIRKLLDGLRERTREQFLGARTVGKGRRRKLLVDGKRALAATGAQHSMVQACIAGFARAQDEPGFYEVLDVARRIAGTGSLGVERYVILVQGKGAPDGNQLLDLKAALPSSLLPRLRCKQPYWPTEAQRVVALQQRMQAVAMASLQTVMMGRRAFVLRALQPSEDRIALPRLAQAIDASANLLADMGRIVAWAQLRSAGRQGSADADALIDFGSQQEWRARLIDAAEHCALQIRKDAATFNAAFDDGAFYG